MSNKSKPRTRLHGVRSINDAAKGVKQLID